MVRGEFLLGRPRGTVPAGYLAGRGLRRGPGGRTTPGIAPGWGTWACAWAVPRLSATQSRIDALEAAESGGPRCRCAIRRGPRSRRMDSSPLRLELARSLLVLGRIERRRKARQSPSARPYSVRSSWPPRSATGRCRPRSERELPRVAPAGPPRLTVTEQRVAEAHRWRRDQPRRRGAPLRQRSHHRDARRLHLDRKLGVRTRAELGRKLLDAPASSTYRRGPAP